MTTTQRERTEQIIIEALTSAIKSTSLQTERENYTAIKRQFLNKQLKVAEGINP